MTLHAVPYTPTIGKSVTPVFARESVGSILASGGMSLAREHWEELMSDLGAYNPNYEGLLALEAAGAVRGFSVRLDDQLAGYAAFLLGPSVHQKDRLQAGAFAVYLSRAHRTGLLGARLLAFAEAGLAEDGVVDIVYNVRESHQTLGTLLARRGYSVVEKVYRRRIG